MKKRPQNPDCAIRIGNGQPNECPPGQSPTNAAEPIAGLDVSDDPCDLDEPDLAAGETTDDDARWDVFIPDDDERDPLPGLDDFWNDEFPNDE